MNKTIDIIINSLFNKNSSLFSIIINSNLEFPSSVARFVKITNSKIDKYTSIGEKSIINNADIGRFCSIGMDVKIGTGIHPTKYISTNEIFYTAQNPYNIILTQTETFNYYLPTVIGNDVWIGSNVLVLDGIKIADGAIVGAGSIVTKDVSSYNIVGGVPAKLIRQRFSEEIIQKLLQLKWWNYPIETLKKEQISGLFNCEVDDLVINKLKDRLLEIKP